MFCCCKTWTDFVVKGGTEMYKERVYFDKVFWSDQLPKLERFFDTIVLPQLAYPRVKYGLCPFNLSEAYREHKFDRGQMANLVTLSIS